MDNDTLITWVQKDMQQIKQALDQCLRPFRKEVRYLTSELRSTRQNLKHTLQVQNQMLLLIKQKAPGLLDDALHLVCWKGRNFETFKARKMFELAKLEKANENQDH